MTKNTWKTPFKWIPNVRKVHLPDGLPDYIFSEYGLKRWLKVNKIKFENFNNGHLNHYIRFQTQRLRKLNKQGQIEAYWKVAKYLISHSESFMLSALQHVKPKWEQDMEIGKLLNLIETYKSYRLGWPEELDIMRFYIHEKKADGTTKIRPIGAPKMEQRMLLHLLNGMIVVFCENRLKPSQHGFLPGKGVITAWREIFEKVINSPDIFEFDLEKFFDKVDLPAVKISQTQIGFPTWLSDYLFKINKSPVTIIGPAEIDEKNSNIKRMYSKFPSGIKKLLTDYVTVGLEQNLSGLKLTPEESDLLHGQIRNITQLMESYKKDFGQMDFWVGFPQGSPVSPIQANILLDQTLLGRAPNVQYADDGLFYGRLKKSIEIESPEMLSAGIKYSAGKCHWVKKDGVWLKNLKFLGLEYCGINGKYRASTRKGSQLELDPEKEELVSTYDHRMNETPIDNWTTFEEAIIDVKIDDSRNSPKRNSPVFSQIRVPKLLSKHEMTNQSIWGWTMSRLMIGKWDYDLEQNFGFKAKEESWIRQIDGNHMITKYRPMISHTTTVELSDGSLKFTNEISKGEEQLHWEKVKSVNASSVAMSSLRRYLKATKVERNDPAMQLTTAVQPAEYDEFAKRLMKKADYKKYQDAVSGKKMLTSSYTKKIMSPLAYRKLIYFKIRGQTI